MCSIGLHIFHGYVLVHPDTRSRRNSREFYFVVIIQFRRERALCALGRALHFP